MQSCGQSAIKDGTMGFILRVLVVALGLWLASVLVPGIQVEDVWTLVGAALLLGIVNALVRPLLVILTLPITILTLGLFLLVINAALLGLVASFFEGFVISSFCSALLGAMIVSLTGWVVSWFIGSRGQVEVMVRRERF